LESAAAGGICGAVAPGSWTAAAQSNPQLAPALTELSKHAVATWYTDRWGADIDGLLSKCGPETIPSIVIYGLPNKDCADGFSSGGSNKSPDDYKKWIQALVSKVGARDVIYVLEPDAIGLLSNNNCAKQNDYMGNLKAALGLISAGNPNAKVYADVASWATQNGAIAALQDLKSAGRLNGITINTANYKTNDQLTGVCQAYSGATGGLHCAFDTSRNYRGSVGDEWCNSRTAGIGAPPGPASGLVDYYLWLKVPGESDGQCTGRSPDAMQGPAAGAFFVDGFTSLWNNGWFVASQGLPKIGGGGAWPSNPTTSPPSWTATPATTAAPSVWSTAPMTTTSAPTTDAPTTTLAPTTTPHLTTAPPMTTTHVSATVQEAPHIVHPPAQAPTDAPTETPIPTQPTTTDVPATEPVTIAPTEPVATDAPTEAPRTTSVATTSRPPAVTEDVATTQLTTAAPVVTTASVTSRDASVQSSSSNPDKESASVSMVLMIACVAMAGVVAIALVVVVARKMHAQARRKDFPIVKTPEHSILVLGNAPETDRGVNVL
ncbi:hypothetical protein As57867_015856, partial [Aphanomyces stellatus]